MIKFALGIPYKTQIKTLLKCLNILDIGKVYLINKCMSIKLLHRNDTTKKILSNLDNPNWWNYKELNFSKFFFGIYVVTFVGFFFLSFF